MVGIKATMQPPVLLLAAIMYDAVIGGSVAIPRPLTLRLHLSLNPCAVIASYPSSPTQTTFILRFAKTREAVPFVMVDLC